MKGNNIIKKPFVKYNEEEVKPSNKPMAVKLNDSERLIIEVGQYMLNLDSKSGTLKFLARAGIKVLLKDFSADDWHYLTSPERRRYQYSRPNIEKLLHELENFKKS